MSTAPGLDYLNNRYHDPTTGTFLSVDPLVASTGQAYLYGNGNPVTYSDPTGLSPQDVCVGTNRAAEAACIRAQNDAVYGVGRDALSFVEDQLDPKFPTRDAKKSSCYSVVCIDRTPVGYSPSAVGWPVKPVKPLPVGCLYCFPIDDGWSLGLGVCWVFACLDAGVSSKGPYVKPGVGLALDFPSVDIGDAPDCGTEENKVFASAGLGPVQGNAAWVWDSGIATGTFEKSGSLSANPVDWKKVSPSAGGGFVHSWTVC